MTTTKPSIISIALNKPLYQTFDYLVPSDITIQPGTRVKVPFGRSHIIGIALRANPKSTLALNQLKSVNTILDDEPVLTPMILKLCEWAANYYHAPIGEVLFNAIPNALRKEKQVTPRNKKKKPFTEESTQPIALNGAQKESVEKITAAFNRFKCFLLYGVTGSGKTEVYLQTIDELIKQEGQALVLVPEIALTPQIVNRFEKRFSVPVACIHSNLNNTERLIAWQKAKSGEAKIVIGTRSAIFTPFKNLGLIVVDEEQDSSFKQQTGFRYSARDLAIIRAQFENFPVVLGSATPSFETLKNAESKRYTTLYLPERAGNAVHPSYHLIDTRHQKLEDGLSPQMIARIEEHLKRDNQVLIFLNRRGFAPTVMCHECGFIATCRRCDAHLTLHHNKKSILLCHHCETQQPLTAKCPACGKEALFPLGTGTERVESALEKLFPNIEIVRVDRDTTRRKNALNELWKKVKDGKRQILIGTQLIAKGHHFPNVTLVGVINADGGFFSTDFRATERMGQLLTQVAGRSGRADKPGEVYIQTHHPDHPLLQQLIHKGFNHFAELALKDRSESCLPPYSHFALLRAKAHGTNHPLLFLKEAKACCLNLATEGVEVLGPIPAPMPKRQGYFRAQLLIQSENRTVLHDTLKKLVSQINELKSSKRVKWSLDVDPVDMY